ncbi:retinol dehydrogenase 8-like [Callorhinchus milii]|uniref:retinol dehydrogenase 8 n=1 Tax=Callorhinchus milii TaxID=7868 RepID=UPI001C3F63F7|nr:retinol dehydrogenase 8 [Callorhinchus milii]XP_042201671.1 retinol dehydrogenase 8-like [Callorhinchus milii]
MASDGQKVVLITGCSSGIGLRLAVQLASDPLKRFHVIATMRNLSKKGKLEEAAGATLNKTLHIAQLDVCYDESVTQCLSSIQAGRVDIVVNNAGVGKIGPVESLSIEEMKTIFETNFFGVVRMIKALLPDMKKRQSGHIVVMSSVIGLQGVVFNDVYAASKFAIEGFCESLAVQLLKFNIYVSMIEPGPVNTEFEMKLMEEVSQSEFPGADPVTVQYFKDVYLPASHDIFMTMGQTPDAIAQATMKVISMERPVFRYQTNVLYTPLIAMKYADNTGNLSVRTFYNLLFNHGTMFKISLTLLRIITCNCFRSGEISPN